MTLLAVEMDSASQWKPGFVLVIPSSIIAVGTSYVNGLFVLFQNMTVDMTAVWVVLLGVVCVVAAAPGRKQEDEDGQEVRTLYCFNLDGSAHKERNC